MYSRIAPFSILMVEAVVPGLPCPLAPPGSRAWEALRGDGAGEEGRSRGISNSASPPWAIPLQQKYLCKILAFVRLTMPPAFTG